MIRAKNDPFEIDIEYDWEESDKLMGQTLGFETEQHFLELARGLRKSLMGVPLTGTPEMMDQMRVEQSYLRGKYDLLLQLVADSKEAKVQAHLI